MDVSLYPLLSHRGRTRHGRKNNRSEIHVHHRGCRPSRQVNLSRPRKPDDSSHHASSRRLASALCHRLTKGPSHARPAQKLVHPDFFMLKFERHVRYVSEGGEKASSPISRVAVDRSEAASKALQGNIHRQEPDTAVARSSEESFFFFSYITPQRFSVLNLNLSRREDRSLHA